MPRWMCLSSQSAHRRRRYRSRAKIMTDQSQTTADVISLPELRLRRDLRRLAKAINQPEWVVAFVLRRAAERLEKAKNA